jgi:hypothetical protein
MFGLTISRASLISEKELLNLPLLGKDTGTNQPESGARIVAQAQILLVYRETAAFAKSHFLIGV